MANFSGLKIYLTYGAKGNGKSLSQARDALQIFREYERTKRRYPQLPERIYYGNQKFCKEIEEKYLGTRLFYWTNAKELRYCPRPNCWLKLEQQNEKNPEGRHALHDTDIAHDEIGKDLPAGSWQDTPKWFRQIFSHLRKRGNRYFANTQVYEDIDIAFRRQIDFAWKIKKVIGSGDVSASLPPRRFVWGLIVKKQFDPMILEHERDPKARENKQEIEGSGMPSFFFITKRLVSIYNTKDELPPYKPDTLEHQEMWCENPKCPKHGFDMREPFGKAQPKLEHYRI